MISKLERSCCSVRTAALNFFHFSARASKFQASPPLSFPGTLSRPWQCCLLSLPIANSQNTEITHNIRLAVALHKLLQFLEPLVRINGLASRKWRQAFQLRQVFCRKKKYMYILTSVHRNNFCSILLASNTIQTLVNCNLIERKTLCTCKMFCFL